MADRLHLFDEQLRLEAQIDKHALPSPQSNHRQLRLTADPVDTEIHADLRLQILRLGSARQIGSVTPVDTVLGGCKVARVLCPILSLPQIYCSAHFKEP